MSSYSAAACQSAAGRIVRSCVPIAHLTIRPLDDWLALRARTHADRPALIAGGRTVTYAELDAEAAACARRLAALGVGDGDRVATTLPAGAAFAALLHALPRLGAVLVPVDPRERA